MRRHVRCLLSLPIMQIVQCPSCIGFTTSGSAVCKMLSIKPAASQQTLSQTSGKAQTGIPLLLTVRSAHLALHVRRKRRAVDLKGDAGQQPMRLLVPDGYSYHNDEKKRIHHYFTSTVSNENIGLAPLSQNRYVLCWRPTKKKGQ